MTRSCSSYRLHYNQVLQRLLYNFVICLTQRGCRTSEFLKPLLIMHCNVVVLNMHAASG